MTTDRSTTNQPPAGPSAPGGPAEADATRERQVHGGLVEVLGSGVLIMGPSGVGKSETALELVARGHRLVADDIVILTYHEGVVCGRSPATIRHHIEIRGIGIVYLPDLYGPDSVRDEGQVDLVCHLEHWREGEAYERVGLDRPREEWCGVMLPALVLPVRPSANMATLVEVAVRDEQQRKRGPSAADRLDARLREPS